jgi:hypothetical protein
MIIRRARLVIHSDDENENEVRRAESVQTPNMKQTILNIITKQNPG